MNVYQILSNSVVPQAPWSSVCYPSTSGRFGIRFAIRLALLPIVDIKLASLVPVTRRDWSGKFRSQGRSRMRAGSALSRRIIDNSEVIGCVEYSRLLLCAFGFLGDLLRGLLCSWHLGMTAWSSHLRLVSKRRNGGQISREKKTHKFFDARSWIKILVICFALLSSEGKALPAILECCILDKLLFLQLAEYIVGLLSRDAYS